MKTLKTLYNQNIGLTEAKDKVLTDVMELSSGTIASISGKRKYDDIQEIRDVFIDFVDKRRGEFKTWQQAWKELEKFYDTKKMQMKFKG